MGTADSFILSWGGSCGQGGSAVMLSVCCYLTLPLRISIRLRAEVERRENKEDKRRI